MTYKDVFKMAAISAAVALSACSSDDDDDDTTGGNGVADPLCSVDSRPVANINGEMVAVPSAYAFPSVINEGECSISYTGQTARNVMISDMKALIASDEIANSATPEDDLNDLFGTGSLVVDKDAMPEPLDQIGELTHGQTSKAHIDVIAISNSTPCQLCSPADTQW